MNAAVSLLVGVLVGTFSGLIGLGGAAFLIPILVYGYGMDQKSAQGTSIATLLLPIGALAFWKYYSAGHVDIRLAALLAVGFIKQDLIKSGVNSSQIGFSTGWGKLYPVCDAQDESCWQDNRRADLVQPDHAL